MSNSDATAKASCRATDSKIPSARQPGTPFKKCSSEFPGAKLIEARWEVVYMDGNGITTTGRLPS